MELESPTIHLCMKVGMSQHCLLYTSSIWGLREGMLVIAFAFNCVAPKSAFVLQVWFGVATLIASLPDAVHYRE
jgi:hypothetical protein